MFLKSMEVFGFKSFADRTKIDFEQGITVIVGPNGCGKSNIVDSAKWVLGEKQAKNIRGQKMEDVIFIGTESRKPLSLAEVSIIVDNQNRMLEFDSDSVTVTRRVFRDGESEYLINKSPVRLKDIDKLFMDTGIGKTSYSVMEQGRIDMILSSKAEDRRYIFEEAAGISRFKMQKKDSLRKLEETRENLDRINDIIHEIEREKDLKAKQAEKTKVYISMRDELKKNDIKINVLKYRDISQRKDKFVQQIEKLKAERQEISDRISDVSEENEKDEQRRNDIQLQLFELDKKLHTFRLKVEDIDSKTAKNNELINEQENRRKKLETEIAERKNVRIRLIGEKEKNIENGKVIAEKIEEDRTKLKELFETRRRKIEEIHSSRDQIDKNREEISDKEKQLVELREELEIVIRQLIDAIDKRKAELLDSEDERQKVRTEINSLIKDVNNMLEESKRLLGTGLPEDALSLLTKIDLNYLNGKISEFESFEDGFRSILFDKTGIHAKKENIDSQIRAKMTLIENLRTDNANLENRITMLQSELDSTNDMITRIEKDLSRNDNEKNWIEKNIQSLDRQIEDFEKQINNLNSEIDRSVQISDSLKKEIEDWQNKLVEFNDRSAGLTEKIQANNIKKEEIDKKIKNRKESGHKDSENLEKINVRLAEQEKNLVELNFRITNIEEYLWTEYEKRIADINKIKADQMEFNDLNQQFQQLKKSIQDLGPINNLAIEEFNDLKKRYEYYSTQKSDIEKAREDILSVIEDINKTSVDMFLETFTQIQKNFSEIFKQLFEGGNAEIVLVDTENILESGIEITVRPPGKKPKSINLLSGGERSMTALALLFSTYMVKPSPFCFLDEIDAALDEENVGRFLRMLKQFALKTQFIMITHNKKTMSIASSIYGITMEEPGVSKVASVRLEKK
ncbi:MAG: AAA family ATPase [Spirochaetes bacterium]|nr:AAA family ATPase [Spirochaetota bacterium]